VSNDIYAKALAVVRGIKAGCQEVFTPGTIMVAQVYRFATATNVYRVYLYALDGTVDVTWEIDGKAAVARAIAEHVDALAVQALPDLFGTEPVVTTIKTRKRLTSSLAWQVARAALPHVQARADFGSASPASVPALFVYGDGNWSICEEADLLPSAQDYIARAPLGLYVSADSLMVAILNGTVEVAR
jgi:hypothetical protein